MALLQRFRECLHDPPAVVNAAVDSLLARADRVAASIPEAGRPDELDVVVAGSGFLSLYFLGVNTVLTRISNVKRYAGASSGAQAPFQLLLTGERPTLTSYLVHGYLCSGQWLPSAMLSADKHWRALGNDIIDANKHELGSLDGKCFVSVTHIFHGNAVYSRFSDNPELAKEAFYATGTLLTSCNGMWSTDGGVTRNEPIFSEPQEGGTRQQLVVRPVRASLPMRMAVGYTLEQAVHAIKYGQDDAARFFGATGENEAISTHALALVPHLKELQPG
mmetsp:Transcript_27826/g.46293  ORF Transcript_27826/g.46293 Transcript_27826/m.46293 type:complete len:276 (+) Transcript_27826:177-1004(+)|eukprot:CAMPEP_0119315436 /NCGR_PEP_ID=MMETSP1333-20130426/35847_1 /TAXON_ID=418940 /ORGANISM="Scyphosphaera apsteinii, Strain RCC1455" /LENGTH=275 /DNA_ID=CAMNT_0007320795 /DNA_START=177 /DNA_END=1004 /DNA_ORIENTATION=+